MSSPPPFWAMSPFVGFFCDPYIEGTQLEGGHIANSMIVLEHVLKKLAAKIGQHGLDHTGLHSFSIPDVDKFKTIQSLLADSTKLSADAAKAQGPEDLLKVLGPFVDRIQALSEKEYMLVPGGWKSLKSQGSVLYLIQRTGEHRYSFVICNAGAGLEYHPSCASDQDGTPPKMKYKTCLRMDNILPDRITDLGFWSALFTMWVKDPPSEYHRVEALYDALLPWLVCNENNRLLPEAFAETRDDPYSAWKTPQRSGTSSFQCLWQGVQYLMRSMGFTPPQLKQFAFVVRKEFLFGAMTELVALAKKLPTPPNALLEQAKTRYNISSEDPDNESNNEPRPTLAQLSRLVPDLKVVNVAGEEVPLSEFVGKTVAIYFSAHWCPPCRAFTPKLMKTYRNLQSQGKNFEVIFVSSDRSLEEFQSYFSSMPWMAIPFSATSVRNRLGQLFGVQGIPSMIIFDSNGELLTTDGRSIISRDPSGRHFPWTDLKEMKNDAGASAETPTLTSLDFNLLQLCFQQISASALKENDAQRMSDGELVQVQELLQFSEQLVGQFERDDNSAQVLPPLLECQTKASSQPFLGCHLLVAKGTDRYAGRTSEAGTPHLANLLDVPRRATTPEQIVVSLVRCSAVCEDLLARARDGGTSSRMVLQLQVAAVIRALFTEVIPIPCPVDADPESAEAKECVWKNAFRNYSNPETSISQAQLLCLQNVHNLALTYATIWQAMERPTRDFDSERSLVAASMLAIFDVIVRIVPSSEPLIISELMRESGGYYLSTGCCQDGRSYEDVAARTQLCSPELTQARDQVLAYLASIKRTSRSELYPLRMPDKIEIKKYGATVEFLRKFMERCGYELIPRENSNPPPEMEALMEWLVSERTVLAREHPEFGMMRDMAALFKFLATMETQETELLRKRMEPRPMYWKLSFEESTGRRYGGGGWRCTVRPLTWEVVNFRGFDMDTADITIFGFGGRELKFGEGPVAVSPCDVGRVLSLNSPGEDDILHSTALPLFDGTISREESEQLFSMLTVDYIRIPLVVGFFATQDRATYLFHPELQQLLRAVVFESGPWIPESSRGSIEKVPVRQTARQILESLAERRKNANIPEEVRVLGTSAGLLINELQFAPESTLSPLLQIVSSISELRKSSVYSPDATYILYMIELSVDIQEYLVYTINQLKRNPLSNEEYHERTMATLRDYRAKFSEFLHSLAFSILEAYREEAEMVSDIPTSCVIHGYLALLWTSLTSEEMDESNVAALLGSMAYVRNWHGFGLGQNRSDIVVEEDGEIGSAEQRLIRFLQSRGVDTSQIAKGSLDQYISSSNKRRPLFLHVGRDVIRAPTLVRREKAAEGADPVVERLPPSDVPEARLFSMLQKQRRSLIAWFDALSNEQLDQVMQQILRVALRSPEFEYGGWQKTEPGRYMASRAELKVDVQSAEVLWRNDELRPVPDSMSQYSDFETIFGKEALHCGIVARQEHRLWVHIIGTAYDLLEWDAPTINDQGLNFPLPPPKEEEPTAQEYCARCGLPGNCWSCETCTYINCGQGRQAGTPCAMCGTPYRGSGEEQQRGFGRGEQMPTIVDDNVVYNQVQYNRPFDLYSENEEAETHENEQWIVDILQPTLLAIFPEQAGGGSKKMTYSLLFPEQVYPAECSVARLIGCDSPKKEDATWKEFVVYRHRKIIHVFNLISHSRRMYRSLVFTSDTRYCLHSLAPETASRSEPAPPELRLAGGNIQAKQTNDSSLLITRRNEELGGGNETYIPPRLLQGVIPSSLLESFHFWQGEDLTLRGEPVDEESQWYNYLLEVTFKEVSMETGSGVEKSRWVAEILRKPISSSFTPIQRDEQANNAGGLLREGMPAGGNQNDQLINDFTTEMNVMSLVALGFSVNACRLALRKNNNNMAAASEWLFDEGSQAEIIASDLASDSGQDVQMSEPRHSPLHESGELHSSMNTKITNKLVATHTKEKIDYLEAEGYSANASKHALEMFNGDLDLSIAWLQDEDNALEIAMLEEKSSHPSDMMDIDDIDDDNQSMRSSSSGAIVNSMKLLNLMETPEDEGTNSFLYRLGSLLARIEDLSHILVWSTSSNDLRASSRGSSMRESSSNDEQTMRISLIELPRLKIKFQPRSDQEGRVRLYLLDYAGWYVSDVNEAGCSSVLKNVLQGLHHSLIIENDIHEMQVLVANHDIYRPKVKGQPFLSDLVCDRTSMGWQQVMESRFFLYPIHTSRTFLLPKTLSSSLYLILLRLMNRDYVGAMKQIESCYVDTEFTSEEQWIFAQFKRSEDDRHPDAHACRLKLSLSVMYSKNRVPWEVHNEMGRYLAKYSHVSSACRLSPHEELDIVYQCKSGSNVIRNRLEYLKSLLGDKQAVQLKPNAQRWGGQPWMKLRALTADYIAAQGSQITRLHYKRPEGTSGAAPSNDQDIAAALAQALGGGGGEIFTGLTLKDQQCLTLLWDSLVMADEESGSNRQLGFLFLYEVLQGKIQMVLGEKNCTRSLGEIFTRLFQLKLARWGKETVEEGETDAACSQQMAWLASMLECGQGASLWPSIPGDSESQHCLRRGINLYTAANRERGMMIKSFLEAVQGNFNQVLSNESHRELVQHQMSVLNALRTAPLAMTGSVTPIQPDPMDQPPALSDNACSQRILTSKCDSLVDGLAITLEDLQSFGGFPLSPIELEQFIVYEASKKKVSDKLPFNISQHPLSESVVAQDMLSRIQEDVTNFAEAHNTRKEPRLINLTPEDIEQYALQPESDRVQTVIDQLDEICKVLSNLSKDDTDFMQGAINKITTSANQVPASSATHVKFLMKRHTRQRSFLTLDYITAALTSARAVEDLLRVNPFLQNPDELLNLTSALLFFTSRINLTNNAIYQVRSLQKLLQQLQRSAYTSEGSAPFIQKIQQAAISLAETLTSQRFFVTNMEGDLSKMTDVDQVQLKFDPRFLVFEYIFDIMLRERQVEMVESFVQSCREGNSRVQQMIMGAGKTTVVGPLLALILADGEALVTQVMPTALLEQSRNVLRSRFSAILCKRVYTLLFDRGCEDDVELVAQLYAKLDSARRTRSVVCAPPEAIKSLMLKFVEQLHSLEQVDLTLLEPTQSLRMNKEIVRLRDTMIARSEMADALVRIYQLWKQGVLIMDEVDVLLHPLRSELNFPIGNKQAIDLSGYRWDLPIHMFDALFYLKREKMCEAFSAWESVESQAGYTAAQTIAEIAQVIEEGYELHALQKMPHLVLLNPLFYHERMQPVMARWVLLWLLKNFVGDVQVGTETLLQYLQGQQIEQIRDQVEQGLLPESKKLLNLAANWIRSLLPHVISKINRVSYGLLGPADASMNDPRTPQSRLLMAVPFVGKDVPSRSSEFAHPDVLIGLTILAFRYEGVRKSDLARVISQLKQDYSRQVGPREKRPACRTFDSWLSLSSRGGPSQDSSSILPLPLFQPTDKKQLDRLFTMIHRLPELIHYLLQQHIFPACMNFQKLKVSACGHELGSDILFGKRIGFSGTPSNLLPVDLGTCQYEPRSDGKIIHVLTSPQVTSASKKQEWSARSLLRDMAKADPPVHALIDTGALITGMDNEEVARYLLLHLPDRIEGVVYLDRQDRQMILLRDSGRSVNLAQCGISPANRFTFYDQVHTTGMDIKQAPNAQAVLTIGKDMTFRDYAQGAYRMRGIGKGQTIQLYIIPEVQHRIETDLGQPGEGIASLLSGRPELDVPAWLLLNSMRMESIQFIQMSTQELHNVWRKKALASLLMEVEQHALHASPPPSQGERLRRFGNPSLPVEILHWLRRSVAQFREPISYAVDDCVPVPQSYVDKLQVIVKDNEDFADSASAQQRIELVMSKVSASHTSKNTMQDTNQLSFNAEVVHENEQEAQEEAEEEAEEEEQKVSAFTRDDEQANPWNAQLLKTVPSGKLGEEAFYPFREFQVQEEQPKLPFPERLLLSDNFFRPTWCGLGDRRLKNVMLVLEWIPGAWSESVQETIRRYVRLIFAQLTMGCNEVAGECSNVHCAKCPANVAVNLQKNELAALSLQLAVQAVKKADLKTPILCPSIKRSLDQFKSAKYDETRFLAAVSLAEGETIRRLIHSRPNGDILRNCHLALRTVSGLVVDTSLGYLPEEATYLPTPEGAIPGENSMVQIGLQCLRFINCEMYYTENELELLERGLSLAPLDARLAFFSACLRLRKRERNLWGDTPLARIFTPQEQWHLLRTRALLEQVNVAIQQAIKKRHVDPNQAFRRFDTDNDDYLSYEELQRALEWMRLGFSPRDYFILVRHADSNNNGKIHLSDFRSTFRVPEKLEFQVKEKKQEVELQGNWMCQNCTYINSIHNHSCSMCEYGWTGMRECPSDKWECMGCTFYNPKTQFYCEVCDKARADLASVRF